MQNSLKVVVIGAGPVGITIALGLIRSGFQVILVESGNDKSEEPHLTQSDYLFKSPSLMPQDVHRLGGGSTKWIGRIGEFLPLDFLSIKSVREECWPILYPDLEPWYRLAYSELSDDVRLDREILDASFPDLIAKTPKSLDYRLIRYADKSYFQRSLNECGINPEFQLLQSHKCLEITKVRSSRSSAEEYSLRLTSQGGEVHVVADIVIVSCGALNSAILLKNSPSVISNEIKELIGYGLMEHFDGFVGDLLWRRSINQNLIRNLVLDRNRVLQKNGRYGLGLKMSEQLRELNNLPNIHFEIVPRRRTYFFDRENITLLGPFRQILFVFERIVKRVFRFTTEFVENLCGIARYSIWVKGEELPNSESCVTTETILGHPYIAYNHTVSAKSKQSLLSAFLKVQETLKTEGLGEVVFDDGILEGSHSIYEGLNWHPMGTLRMASNSQKGVVDENLRLLSSQNIFVCDSSVFPTGSNGNPTFTSIALGLRLIDSLKSKRENV
jgi:hypothetical protein